MFKENFKPCVSIPLSLKSIIPILFFRFYTIIVNPKIEILYDPKPSEITSYNEEKPDSAYLTGILASHQSTFVVGMYGSWFTATVIVANVTYYVALIMVFNRKFFPF